jgi:iron transport multicopper oxidase
MVYEYTGDSAASVETVAASSSTSQAAASSTSVSVPTGTPAIVPVVGPYTYIGCVNDIDTRLLTADHTSSNDMTIEDCAAYCSGYQYFGLEYTREC